MADCVVSYCMIYAMVILQVRKGLLQRKRRCKVSIFDIEQLNENFNSEMIF